ncbi:hypothetical protein TSTA_025450 [Talaromyces stipitatus ATCC 10500]|uniref:Rhodopsin domain-containing protein n=1 Tax=Talaromyces stipitatus (strain ATCC 10500 / CBS 375.48 / QM 6759 / NRRL 1006) TaxID=441959 RepID=B8M4N3_TALSN|nr:uncharacterized protein TSTA_025450 [Talaromyces stipitatus ATCC 10500]EED19228.1 hypothetical protein TSTA_025450 [Talaromyces stipitatus ATCC 10500]
MRSRGLSGSGDPRRWRCVEALSTAGDNKAFYGLIKNKEYHLTILTQILQCGVGFYITTLLLVEAAILLQWIRLFAPEGTRRAFYVCKFRSRDFLRQLANPSIVERLVGLPKRTMDQPLILSFSPVAGNLICIPFKRIWDKTVPGDFYNGRPLNMTIGAFNLLSDIFILILPQGVIWRMTLSRKEKIGVAARASAAFRLGIAVVYMIDPDRLYRASSLSMTYIAKMTCILLVYCMPGIPQSVQRLGHLVKGRGLIPIIHQLGDV